jgi:hypothetical protein
MSSNRNTASKLLSSSKGMTASRTQNPSVKFDLNGSGKVKNSTEFSKHLQSLQKQTQQDPNIEDEYIKNLQQQIAYMELELKLLKEKEVDNKQSVSQIDKFFNDGVPLNENILALKNQYQAAKKDVEMKMDDVNDARLDEKKLNIDLENEYKYLLKHFSDLEALYEAKEKEHSKTMNEMRIKYIEERNTKAEKEKDLKKIMEEYKRKHDEIVQWGRLLEKAKAMEYGENEKKKMQREKLLHRIKDKDAIANELSDMVTELKSKSTFNPDIKKLENENLDLQSRKLVCEREFNMADTKIKELRMLKDMRGKERQVEAELRRDLSSKIATIKTKIDEENKANDLVIAEKVRVKEEKEKKDIQKTILARTKDKQNVTDLKEDFEKKIEELGNDGANLKHEVLDLEQQIGKLTKDTAEEKKLITFIMAQMEHLTKVNAELNEKTKTQDTTNMKIDEETRKLKPKIEQLKAAIEHLLKLAKLSKELKAFNLEELLMMNKSNRHVTEQIQTAIKEWEKIKTESVGYSTIG